MTMNVIAPAEPAAIMVPELFQRRVEQQLAIARACCGLPPTPPALNERIDLWHAATAVLLDEMFVAGNA
jgi:hypothetical protein